MQPLTRFAVSLSLVFGVACSDLPIGPDGATDVDAAAPDAALEDAGAPEDAALPENDAGPRTFLDRYPLMAQYPESGIYDPEAHAFYVGSLGDGTLHRVDAETGAEEVFFTEAAVGTWWTLGMAIDETRRRLWVCAMDDKRETSSQDPPYDGYIWIFDLATGERVASHALSDAFATATCTDVAVTSAGTGYVCDREHPNIYEVDEVDGASLFATSDELDSSIVGQNAIVVLPDESALLTTVYLPSRIVRVDLADRSVRRVDITGSFFDATPLSGADGMVYSDGSVYVTFASELVRVTPSLADWSSADAREVVVPNGMTDAVVTPNGLYLVNGQSIRFALGTDPDPFALVRFVGSF